jgi:hypothetical protein
MSDGPVYIKSKTERWTERVGLISQGLPNIPKGAKYYWGYQKAAGTRKHSGPSGRRGFRFYQGAFRSSVTKKSKMG